MPKVIFILGLCGSGKTPLSKEIENAGAKIFEGIEGENKSSLQNDMIQHLKKGGDCVVEEIKYCRQNYRNIIVEKLRSEIPDVEIEWICFENDINSANWNVENRSYKNTPTEIRNHLWINQQYHDLYTYPAKVEIRAIKRIEL